MSQIVYIVILKIDNFFSIVVALDNKTESEINQIDFLLYLTIGA